MREATDRHGNRIDVHEPTTWHTSAVPRLRPTEALAAAFLVGGALCGWLWLGWSVVKAIWK